MGRFQGFSLCFMLKFKRSMTANVSLKTGGYNHLTPLLCDLYKQNELRGIYIFTWTV